MPRKVTWVKLQDRSNLGARPIVAFNTHFDHRGERARIESARIIRRKIGDIAAGCSAIVTGDFNSGEGSAPYSAIFSKGDDVQEILLDSFRASNPRRTAKEGTFSGFRANDIGAKGSTGSAAHLIWPSKRHRSNIERRPHPVRSFPDSGDTGSRREKLRGRKPREMTIPRRTRMIYPDQILHHQAGLIRSHRVLFLSNSFDQPGFCLPISCLP